MTRKYLTQPIDPEMPTNLIFLQSQNAKSATFPSKVTPASPTIPIISAHLSLVDSTL